MIFKIFALPFLLVNGTVLDKICEYFMKGIEITGRNRGEGADISFEWPVSLPDVELGLRLISDPEVNHVVQGA